MIRASESSGQRLPERPSGSHSEVLADRHTHPGVPFCEGKTAFCGVCQNRTVTVLLPLSSGDIGRVCRECRTCRRGRPYATKREYQQTLKADRPEGGYVQIQKP